MPRKKILVRELLRATKESLHNRSCGKKVRPIIDVIRHDKSSLNHAIEIGLQQLKLGSKISARDSYTRHKKTINKTARNQI